MSRQFGIVNVASFSFGNWIARDNDIINLVNTDVVTTATNTAGDLTVGNGYVIGIFGSNTLTANTLRGGNVTHSTTLTISTNTTFSGEQVNSAANVYINSANVYLYTANSTTVVGNTLFYSNTSNPVLKLISNTTNSNVSLTANTLYLAANIYASNTLFVNGAVSFANTLNVTGNTTLTNLRANYSNIDISDVTTLLSVSPNFVANTSATRSIQFLVGTFTTTGGFIANTSHVIVGNSSVNTVVTNDSLTVNAISTYNIEIYNSAKGANGYFSKLTGANLVSNTVNTFNIEITNIDKGANGYYANLTGNNITSTNTITANVINSNTVSTFNIEITNTNKGANGYYANLTGNNITSSNVISSNVLTSNTITTYNIDFVNTNRGANGYFDKLTGANLVSNVFYSNTISANNIEFVNTSGGANGYFKTLSGIASSNLSSNLIYGNTVTANNIEIKNSSYGVNGYFNILTGVSGNGVIVANTVNTFNIEITNSDKGVNGYYYQLTGNTVTAYTVNTYNMNVSGTLVGTFAPTGNFIPGTNNLYQIGSSSNVFSIVQATTVTSNVINTHSGLLTIGGNVAITGTQLTTSATLNSSGSYNFVSTSQVAIDTFVKTSYRTGEYTLQFTDTSTSSYHVTKIMVYHDGTSAYSTEYSQMFNNSSLATIVVDVSGSNVRVLVTPVSSTVVAKFSRNLLAV